MLLKVCPLLLLTFLILPYTGIHAQGTLPTGVQEKIRTYNENLEQARQGKDLNEQSRWLNKKAFLYWENRAYEQAIDNFNASLSINKKLGNKNGEASIYQQIGMIYSDQQQYLMALNFFEQSLLLRRQQDNKNTLANVLINIAVVHNNLENYKEAIVHLKEALGIVQEIKAVGLIRSCCAMLAENYEKIGDTEKSFEYFNIYASLEKKLQKEKVRRKEQETEKKIKALQATTDKVMKENKEQEKKLFLAEQSLRLTEALNKEKEARIDILSKEKQLKEMALKEKEARLKNELLLKNSFIGGFSLVGALAVLLLLGYFMKKKDNEKLSVKNTEITRQKEELSSKSLALENALTDLNAKSRKITQSITYAQRIQQALLPEEEQLQACLPESFILFKPKDIVSGDFYWFAETENSSLNPQEKSTNKFIVAAVDCTGHGVPGAFMSMIGYNLLDEIIARGIHRAGDILQELNTRVIRALKQNETENDDGMDMALCVIDPHNKTIEFAGAKNPMVYVQNGQLYVLKGDKKGIGGKKIAHTSHQYSTHTIPLQGISSIYLFSDGYQDQFGGEHKRKFMKKNMRKLFQRIHDMPMEQQRKILNHTIENWRRIAGESQVDDILVMGFKLDEHTLENLAHTHD